MITLNKYGDCCVRKTCELEGLSTDEKPVGFIDNRAQTIRNGSTYHELDTGATYKYDEEHMQWMPQNGGGSSAVAEAKLELLRTDVNEVKTRLEKLQSERKGSKILWKGIFINGRMEFDVPKECFYNDGKNLTLVIDSYFTKTASSRIGDPTRERTVMVLHCGNSFDFFPDMMYDDLYYVPLFNQGYVYQNFENDGFVKSYQVKIRSVSDTRNAVCTVQNAYSYYDSGEKLVTTCISAYVPEELES